MKFIPFFLILFAFKTKSQDLIITNANDTIHCKINVIVEGNIYYTLRAENKISHASIALVDVLSYRIKDELAKSKSVQPKVNSRILGDIFKDPQVRFGANIFYARRLASLSDDLSEGIKDHYRQLLNGYGVGVDFVVFIDEENGIGIDYSKSIYSASTDNVFIDSSGVIIHGPAELTDDVEIKSFSPMYYHRFVTGNPRNELNVKLGISFISFQQITELDDLKIRTWGNTIGLVFGGDYSYRVDPNFSLGVGVRYETGLVTDFSQDDGTSVQSFNASNSEYAEDLQRVVISAKGLLCF